MRLWAFIALPVAAALGAGLLAPSMSPAAAPTEQLIDYGQPVQEQFAQWPPAELVQRNYWFPWAKRTFQRAALFGKPVFLFIDSRWNREAHRVREELLADPEVQERLNRGYITIYVNADERPDIVERYQTGTMPVMSLLLPTGNPMITNRTPTGEGMPITIGSVDRERMLFLLEQGNIFYDKWNNFLTHVGQEWAGKVAPEDPVAGELIPEASDRLYRWIEASWDRTDGGIGLAPKFILPGLMDYIRLREARLGPAASGLTANYLPGILNSPLHDTVHGGVHRMAAGPDWTGIQYEKLLDRNAEFLRQVSQEILRNPTEANRAAAAGAARFLREVLADPAGGFFLGQTADFLSEGGGGYWTDADRKGDAPDVDRLFLTGPNAQAGAALIRAGIALERPELVQDGRLALDRVLEEAYRPGRGVRHQLGGAGKGRLYLESLADVAFHLLDAYQTTGEGRYLEAGRNIVDFCINNFRLPGETRFRDHIPDMEPVGLLNTRRMPFRANVQLARAMIRLAHLGAGKRYLLEAEDLLYEYAGALEMYRAHGVLAGVAVEEVLAAPLLVRLTGDPASPGASALRHAVIRAGRGLTLTTQDGPESDGEWPPVSASLVRGGQSRSTTDPEELVRILQGETP